MTKQTQREHVRCDVGFGYTGDKGLTVSTKYSCTQGLEYHCGNGLTASLVYYCNRGLTAALAAKLLTMTLPGAVYLLFACSWR